MAVVSVAMHTGARWFKNHRIPLQTEDVYIYGAFISFILIYTLYPMGVIVIGAIINDQASVCMALGLSVFKSDDKRFLSVFFRLNFH